MPDNDRDLQTEGRRGNAAQPLDAANRNDGAERYPDNTADQIDRTGRTEEVAGQGEEPRSFEPKVRNETAPPSPNEGRLGPAADPVEGKR